MSRRSSRNPLSVKRIQLARETLTEAFHLAWKGQFHGATDAKDVDGVLVEAKRNLTALVHHLHGRKAWEKVLERD